MIKEKDLLGYYEVRKLHELFPDDWEEGMLLVMIKKHKGYYIPYECKYSVKGISKSDIKQNKKYFKELDIEKYRYVYKTTNLLTGEFYIGKHISKELDDDYLGSGPLLKKKIKQYGEDNFKRELLFFCKSEKDLSKKEREIINKYKTTDEWFNMYNLHEPSETYQTPLKIIEI